MNSGTHTILGSTRELLRRVEVLTSLDVSDEELMRWTRDLGFPPPIRIDGARHEVRYRRSAIEAWLAEREPARGFA